MFYTLNFTVLYDNHKSMKLEEKKKKTICLSFHPYTHTHTHTGFPGGSVIKNLPAN